MVFKDNSKLIKINNYYQLNTISLSIESVTQLSWIYNQLIALPPHSKLPSALLDL